MLWSTNFEFDFGAETWFKQRNDQFRELLGNLLEEFDLFVWAHDDLDEGLVGDLHGATDLVDMSESEDYERWSGSAGVEAGVGNKISLFFPWYLAANVGEQWFVFLCTINPQLVMQIQYGYHLWNVVPFVDVIVLDLEFLCILKQAMSATVE